MKFLITGAAGFIGMHVTRRLLDDGHEVVGLDNLNGYYDPALKHYRLNKLRDYRGFHFIHADLIDREAVAQLFAREKFQRVIHLAAQAGVRHSLTAPFDYIDSNLVGTMTILEGCRQHRVEHLVFASSSSVYGMSPVSPFHESDRVDQPVSLYAATKKSCELMAYSYAHLYALPVTGLRFFTVYGPAGRPDMAPWLFTEAILNDRPIKVFNRGKMVRDFTYIDDVVESVVRVQDRVPQPQGDNARIAKAPYAIYNVGNNQPVALQRFIAAIEQSCGKQAVKEYLDMQPGDVLKTYADISRLKDVIGYQSTTPIEEGVESFVAWYRRYQRGNLV